MRAILFLFSSQSCIPEDALAAAKRLQCRVAVLGARMPCGCAAALVDAFERIDVRDVDSVITAAEVLYSALPFHAVVAYDDQAVPGAARIAAKFGLHGNQPAAADAARDKVVMKRRFESARIPIAPYHLGRDEDDAVAWASEQGYPVVVKPVRGSASQGVIRADDEPALRAAYRRLRRIVIDHDLDTGGRPDVQQLVEQYLDGREYSVELIVQNGTPKAFCDFEKPEPLEGPFFEETMYITPARFSPDERKEVRTLAERAATALGLKHGVAHCEVRLTTDGPKVLEIGARLIGGACSRVFRRAIDQDVQQLVLRLALGEDVEVPTETGYSAGALMIPIASDGRLSRVAGIDEARRIAGIDEVSIVVEPGDPILAFPEQSCYVGFVNAGGDVADSVIDSLGKAARAIHLETEPLTCERWSRAVVTEHAEDDVRVYECGLDSNARENVLDVLARSMFGEFPQPLGRNQAERYLEEMLAGARAWILAEGKGVACVLVEGQSCRLEFLEVIASPDALHRREQLLRSAMNVVGGLGCCTIDVIANPKQPAACRFYRDMGFHGTACGNQICCAN